MEHFNWGLPVAIDLFAAGMGAAAFLVAVLAFLIGGKKFNSINLTGAIIAPWPVILGVLLLVVDLGNPLRFWEMLLRRGEGLSLDFPYIMFNTGSSMSWGTWVLTLFVIVSLLYLVVSIVAIPFEPFAVVAKVVGAIGIPLALMVMTYTGVLISATSNDLWSNYLLPTLFVFSAMASGIALIVFILALLKMFKALERDVFIPKLEKLNGWIIGIMLIVLALFVGLGMVTSASAMQVMIGLKLGLLFWVFVLGLGIIIPLYYYSKKGAKNPATSLFISALILIGGFLLRYVILIAGQIA